MVRLITAIAIIGVLGAIGYGYAKWYGSQSRAMEYWDNLSQEQGAQVAHSIYETIK